MKTENLQKKFPEVDFVPSGDFAQKHTELKSAIMQRAGLLFEEHCSECAYPTCYTNCAFYTPREDMHCRRFERGFERIRNSKELKLVRFRKWGKIEAVGGQKIDTPPNAALAFMEIITHLPAMPYLVKRNFNYNLNKEQKAEVVQENIQNADAFILEATSFDNKNHMITISIFNYGDYSNGKMHLSTFEVKPEYGRIIVDLNEIKKNVDLAKPFLIQIEPMNEAEGRKIIFGLCDFVIFDPKSDIKSIIGNASDKKPETKKPSIVPAKNAKLVAWDLDETLWHGILVEDGLEGIELRPEALAAIKALDERGIVHSIVSKNDPDLVDKALKHFGIEEYFLYPQVSWGPKSLAIDNLAKQISLGSDSFVFVDDQPFERAEVGNNHPEVRVLTDKDVEDLINMDFFPTSVTEESKKRRLMYKADEVRSQAMASGGGDYEEFLRKANMTLVIDKLNDKNMPRVFELSQRTNQLNFNGYKYAMEELQSLENDPNYACVTLTCKDNFGEYGLIGFVVINKVNAKIEQFFMSCRAQKKRVEHVFFEWLRNNLKKDGHDKILVSYNETPKNKASKAMLDDLGFVDNEGVFVYDKNVPFKSSDIVNLIDNSDWNKG